MSTFSISTLTSAALAASLLTFGAAAATAPAAHAESAHTRSVAMSCIAMSPNIVDLPYNGGVRVVTRPSAPGTITVIGGSPSLTRYITDATITIRNLTVNASGTVSRRYLHATSGSTAGGYVIPDIYTGPGRISLTITAVNRGLLTLPAPRCEGTLTVR